jgi:RNA polymerase sigma-70 factor (ECF subfamily)
MSNWKEPGLFTLEGKIDSVKFRVLYEANAEMLLKIASRITNSLEAAEDIVQDAFGKMIEKDMTFPSENDAKYWLIRVVKNGAINYSKRKGRESKAYQKWWRTEAEPIENHEAGSATMNVLGTEAGIQLSSEDEIIKKEEGERVRRALQFLPEKLRTVLVLKEYSGMNYKEIGKVLGISEGNVKVRAFRARESLSSFLKEEEANVSRR